jgi:hypothetical protein
MHGILGPGLLSFSAWLTAAASGEQGSSMVSGGATLGKIVA